MDFCNKISRLYVFVMSRTRFRVNPHLSRMFSQYLSLELVQFGKIENADKKAKSKKSVGKIQNVGGREFCEEKKISV